MVNVVSMTLLSHLSIRREAIDPDLLSLKLNVTSSLMAVLREMIDWHVLVNPLFILVVVSNILGFLALYVPYVYLPSMMESKGIDVSRASLVISAIGISNTLGRWDQHRGSLSVEIRAIKRHLSPLSKC